MGPDLTRDEVEYRIPTLDLIEDEMIRDLTIEVTQEAPWYFWKYPATRSNKWHNPVCRKDKGLWAHTLMLSTTIERLRDSYQLRHGLTDFDIDMAHSAAILHDQLKNGTEDDVKYTSVQDHDILMAERADEFGLPSKVGDMIESHMGPEDWYDGPAPETWLDELVHTADMMASDPNGAAKSKGPVPMELQEIGLQEGDQL